jgi:hypothetical protein
MTTACSPDITSDLMHRIAYLAGISLILGGHDHDVVTVVAGPSLIHKSGTVACSSASRAPRLLTRTPRPPFVSAGQNAMWLGRVELDVEVTLLPVWHHPIRAVLSCHCSAMWLLPHLPALLSRPCLILQSIAWHCAVWR